MAKEPTELHSIEVTGDHLGIELRPFGLNSFIELGHYRLTYLQALVLQRRLSRRIREYEKETDE